MPLLFDTVLQEKPSVIFEIGAAYTKLGFAAENCCRCIIPTLVDNPKDGSSKRLFDNATDEQEFHDLVVAFMQKLFFKHALVNPKDRKVVLVESVLCPTQIRETYARVLFQHFEVSSIFFVPLHLAALSSLAVDTALVVDVGFKEAVVVPIFSGVQVLKAWQAQPLAAEAVHDELKGQLILNGVKEELLTDRVIEDIKVRTCFVTTYERARQYKANDPPQPAPPDVDYPILGEEVIKVPGALRETAMEVLFPEDNDHLGLPFIILDAILACPIDMRKTLAENIFLIGGTTMTMGFAARLKAELLALVTSDIYKDRLCLRTFKFHAGISKPNCTGWLGGSIYGTTDLVVQASISRDTYAKNPHLPDWTNTYGGDERRNHGTN